MKEKNEKKSGLARFYQKKKDIEREVDREIQREQNDERGQ